MERSNRTLLFSSDDEVATMLSNILMLPSYFLLTDAAIGITAGSFNGIGRQKWKLYTSIVEVSHALI